jgi:hypothetical protein
MISFRIWCSDSCTTVTVTTSPTWCSGDNGESGDSGNSKLTDSGDMCQLAYFFEFLHAA